MNRLASIVLAAATYGCVFAGAMNNAVYAAESSDKPSGAATTVNTQGEPFEGCITDAQGGEIATIHFFGEGTNTIYFDKHQRLICKNDDGDIIAGFEGIAAKPEKRGLTQAFVVEEEDGSRPMMLEYQVARVTYRNGVLAFSKPDGKMSTSFQVGNDEWLKVTFKQLDQEESDNGEMVNTLTVVCDGRKFKFSVLPSSSMRHTLKPLKGDLAGHLTAKQERLSTSSAKENHE